MANLRDISFLLDKLQISNVPVGVYDAPIDSEFNPIVEMLPLKRTCVFAYYNAWMRGQTLKVASTNFGCLGSGYWLFGKETRNRQSMVGFLADTEGLKCNKYATEQWLESTENYIPKFKTLFIGPLKDSMWPYLKSVTLFVTADQLSSLIIAANYSATSANPQPVKVPFGSGCAQMVPFVANSIEPQAIIGSTDLSMRVYLPENVLSFTMNVSMFEMLCKVGPDSFLGKGYFVDFCKHRESDKSHKTY
jgi:hypothetical protein